MFLYLLMFLIFNKVIINISNVLFINNFIF
uniref:Uncharacterized protein n=1 Tax=viral metagenome TaxID=1070528 RepID=A0A6C0H9Z1_9ZZZZ